MILAINPKSGSQWKDVDIASFRIVFEYVKFDAFVQKVSGSSDAFNLSEKANDLTLSLSEMPTLQELEGRFVQAQMEREAGSDIKDPFLELSLVKATYFVKKYQDQESIVDSFVSLLLEKLGFFDGWLYAFPQMKVPLLYGDATFKEATADFTILDVLSLYRISTAYYLT
jgi:hypothetical protein